jgi:murein DD-endopeptidase MepM/ murein hydrolase activator NlpD
MRRCPYYLLALAVVAGGLTVSSAGGAGAQQCATTKQCQLQQQLSDTSAQEQAARNQLADLQSKRQTQDAALNAINARVSASAAKLAAAQADADRLDAEAAELQTEIDATTKELTQAKQDVRHSALLLYQHSDTAAMLALLSSTDGGGAFVEGEHYLQRVSDIRQADATKVAKLKAALEDQQAQIAGQKKAADDARDAAATEKAQLDALQAQQQASADAAAATEQQASGLLSSLTAQEDALEAQLMAVSDSIAQSLRDAGDGGVTPGNGQFIRPVPGPITSPFGYRVDPLTGSTEFHTGIDFGAACGTPIKAAGSGVVFETLPESQSGGYGNMTIINHGGGLATLYAHQSSIIVSAGQAVTQGQVIGYVGSTGKSTGCHLHWEVRVNGTPVDPMQYL